MTFTFMALAFTTAFAAPAFTLRAFVAFAAPGFMAFTRAAAMFAAVETAGAFMTVPPGIKLAAASFVFVTAVPG